MAIDTSIWGAESTWLTCMAGMAKKSHDRAQALIGTTLTMNELIDNSMCWCGAMQDRNTFYLASPGIAAKGPLNIDPFLDDTQTVVNVPLLFADGASNDSPMGYSSWDNIWGRWAEVSSPDEHMMTMHITGQFRPTFNLKLNKLMWVATVVAFADTDIDNNTTQSFSLGDWIHTGHVDYPYLAQLYITPYYNNGTDAQPDWHPCYDSYDNYIYFHPNLETSSVVQNFNQSNFKIQYDYFCQANRKQTTLLMGTITSTVGNYYTWAPVLDSDINHYIATPTKIRYCRAYSQDLINEIRTQIAFLGVFFLGDYIANMNDATLTHDSVYCGIIDENGYTHGDYSHGEDNEDRQQYDWDDTSESDYDPTTPPSIDDGSVEDTKNKTILPTRGLLMPFTGSYAFYQAPLTGLLNACTHHYIDMQDAIEDWNLNKEEQEDNLDFESYLWRQWGRQANPVDCIQNITYYPFDIIPHIPRLAENVTSVIQVGSFVQDYATSNITGYKVGVATEAGSIWAGGSSNVGIPFPITNANDFRSYAPYVSATLYLPFCGSIELDPQVFVGHTVKVQYLVDWRTGVCLALVYRDNLVVEAVSGQMGNKVNLQMLDGTTWASQLANASVQESNAHFNRAASFFATVGGLASIAGGVAVTVGSEGAAAGLGAKMVLGGISGVAGGLMGMKKADLVENKAAYDIGTTPIPTRQISTASPCVNSENEMEVRLVLFESENEASTNYGHTVGHACLKYGTLTELNCTGYTVCQTIDTAGISATETEKEMIRSLMNSGVYV